MKRLILTALGLASLFAMTFVIIKLTGVLTIEDIQNILQVAHQTNALYVAAIALALLLADLFIAVPTLTVAILSGYFLGFPLGFATAAGGLLGAGTLGYVITYVYGPGLLRRIHKDPVQQAEMESVFAQYGFVVLVICRALPILPEVSCCLAGATRMAFRKFIFAFAMGTLPYAAIATFAGSQSSFENPKPAIFAAIGLSMFFAVAWALLRRHYKKHQRLINAMD